MASYDSPGFTDTTPAGPVNAQGYGAPGSAPQGLPDTSGPLGDRVQQGTVGNSAVVYGTYDSLATADVVTVGSRDTLIPTEADLYGGGDANPLSGMPGSAVGSTGAGVGRTMARHPNAGT